ncbi:MAG: NAD(P)H-dependent oxidoreductase subunit E, partial [Proteobacteria bacterium]|nr:NAD(P)H-dependent oxidoreductase subunit E [Pseudomonadota bacterium]
MTQSSIDAGTAAVPMRRARREPKGRQPDDAAVARVRGLIGPGPYRRDLLIEHLHRINDATGCLHEGDLVALAYLMNLPMAEVYEVASFYHHFDVVRDDVVPA